MTGGGEESRRAHRVPALNALEPRLALGKKGLQFVPHP